MFDFARLHDFFSWIEVYVSLVDFLWIVGATIIFYFWQRRKEQRIIKSLRENIGDKPAVFIVDLVEGRDIRHDVVNFMSTHNKLKDVDDKRIVVLSGKDLSCGNNITPDNINEFLDAFQKKRKELNDLGYDVIHYFHGGPSMLAAMIGARWGNGGRVNLYQHTPGGTYQEWGPLRHLVF